MDKVTLWVWIDDEWCHGTTSDDAMAVELVGSAIAARGIAEVAITNADQYPVRVGTYGGES